MSDVVDRRPEATRPVGEPRRQHRWGIWSFGLVFAVLVLSAVLIGAIAEVLSPGQGISVPVVLVGTMVPPLLAAAVAVLVTVLRGNGPRLDLGLTWRWADVWVGVRLGLIGLVCTSVAAFLWTRIVGEDNASSALGKLVENQRLPGAAAITMFLFVWLIGPVCEEIIYRGLLWGALERANYGRWMVFVLTTVIFAISHLEPLRTSLLLVIGIPIGLARLFTGRLGASIIAHQVNNFLPALAVLLIAFDVMPP
ncbi:MAG TPA: CPBP family intramembrane glutamic endopeptidase [Actinophytocola sp.]|uniref:CPBP family intramembrane glutamic endopeptidase n=1 Tax=Actinophytocola sp. TaxID=1872138 RepID=UPI002DBE7675|nr:CPBP family intramembrane glutamic endopeptidase [Actinophytocola sp.]HEU5475551.1 CPBP family intramembrane glutamic endopeptidase [Actinophytocola sp.]